MTNSWKLQLLWVPDSQVTTRNRGKSQSVNRTLDRRIKRREHHRITKDAVDGWYADGADTLYEYLDPDWGFDEFGFWEPEPYESMDYQEEDYSYDPYDYMDDWGYSSFDDDLTDYWGNRRVSPEDKRFIEREDVGKSLGEILEELRQKRD